MKKALKLFYAPRSSSTRIHWALEELAVPYEKVRVDLRAGEQRKPEYLTINPNGKVPTLVIDGVPMFESLAILIWLGEQFGVEKKLWPALDSHAHADALVWITWGTVTLAANAFRFLSNTSERFPAEQRNAVTAENARNDVVANLRVLEAQLDDREYLLGKDFTLVDVGNASMVGFLLHAGIDLSEFPQVRAWVARCTARPAFATANAG